MKKITSILLIVVLLMGISPQIFPVMAEEVSEYVQELETKREMAELEENQLTAEEMEEMVEHHEQETELETAEQTASTRSTDTDMQVDPLVFQDAPYFYDEQKDASVNLSTGGLNYERIDAVLPGRGGLDLTIGTRYNSDETIGGYSSFYWGKNQFLEKPKDTPLDNFAAGWSMQFSHIILSTLSDFKAVVLFDGRFYEFDDGRDDNGNWSPKYKIKNHKIDDFTLERDTTFTNAGVTSFYLLSYKDGRWEYFDQKGRIMAMGDRFGNQITFVHTDNDNVTITDSCGRVVTISRTYNDLTITLPDSKQIVYEIGRYQVDYTSLSGLTTKITKITDQSLLDTTFEYDENRYGHFNYAIGANSFRHPITPMTKITFPNGAQSIITYENITGKMGEYGHRSYNRVINKKLVHRNETYNETNYTYAGDYGISGETHTTTTTDGRGLTRTYEFDENGSLIYEKELEGDILLSETNYGIHLFAGYPEYIGKKIYNPENPENMMIKDCHYEYDSYGNITEYSDVWSTEGRDEIEHRILYEYLSDGRILNSKTYKQDANTIIKEEYDPRTGITPDEPARITSNGVIVKDTVFTYDEYGNVIERRDYRDYFDNGITTTYTYENGAMLSSKQVGDLPAETYQYDNMGRKISQTDAIGNTTTYTYDELGRMKIQTNPDGTTKKYYYDDLYDNITVEDEKGYSIEYGSSMFGRSTSVLDTHTRMTLRWTQYDNLLRPIKISDGLNNYQQIAYDYYDRPLSKTTYAADGTELGCETYQYDDCYDENTSRIVKTIWGDGNAPSIVTAEYYDKAGRLVKTSRFDGETEYFDTYTLDYLGNVVQTLSAKDAAEGREFTTKTTYRGDGKPLTQTNAANQTITYEYDWLGNLISQTDAMGNTTQWIYDSNGRLVEERRPFDGTHHSVTNYEYDNVGNNIEVYTTNGVAGTDTTSRTSYRYDNRNRLATTITYDGDTQNYTEYRYDGVGNLRFLYTGLAEPLTDQNESQAVKTEYVYDHRGRVIDTIDPMGRHETATYDVNGNMIEKTDRNGAQYEYIYDGANRIIDITATAPGSVMNTCYFYNKTGSLHYARNNLMQFVYKYDNFGRLIEETAQDDIKHYTYNLDDTRSSFLMTDRSINEETIISQTYDYDVLGRLSSVYASGEKIADYTYDANGNLRTKGSGDLSTVYTYNNANMLTSLTNKAKYNELSKFNYTYYLDGNQATKQDSLNGTTTYTYDGMGRLKSETALGYTDTYTYDNFGNRIAKNHVQDGITTTTAYTYDKNNRLLKELESAEGTTAETDYYYDHNGNMLKKIKGFHTPVSNSNGMPEIALTEQTEDYMETYRYNSFNQLMQVTINGENTYYEYDANNMLWYKETGDDTTMFLLDGGNVVAEMNGDYEVTAKYYRGIDLISSERNGITNYYLYDGHGNAIALADRNGAVTRNYQYDAFGNQLNADTNDTNPFRYCGEYWDAETGNIYLRARYYDPSVGRFISEDPARDGLNWYAYCGNNPVMFVDPSGLWGELVHVTATRWMIQQAGLDIDDRVLDYHIEIIVNANIGVDDGDTAATNMNIIAQSWHFDRNADPNIDSRQEHADDMLDRAVYNWNWADDAYARGEITLEGRHQWRVNALEMIGQGLHALQDIDAHMDIGTDNFNNPISSPHIFNGQFIWQWKDIDNPQFDAEETNKLGVYNKVDTGERFGSQRYSNTVTRTQNYIKSFYSQISTAQ